MLTTKIDAGSEFPEIEVKKPDGSAVQLVETAPGEGEADGRGERWQIVVVYRGKHCPICTRFLKDLSSAVGEFNALNTDIVAVSADSVEQLQQHIESDLSDVSLPLYCDIQLQDMKRLGLYLSEPVNDSETDHTFAEPALFVIRPDSKVQLVDIANGPFIRPNISLLLKGLKFIRENDYPVRGTHQA